MTGIDPTGESALFFITGVAATDQVKKVGLGVGDAFAAVAESIKNPKAVASHIMDETNRAISFGARSPECDRAYASNKAQYYAVSRAIRNGDTRALAALATPFVLGAGACAVIKCAVSVEAVGGTISAAAKAVSVADRAAELRAIAGRNRVSIETPNGRLSVDLEGEAHFEKTLGRHVDTPHVKFETRHVSPDGRVSYTWDPVRQATQADLRLVARVLAERGR